jgi:hypothetical protein
VAHIPIGEPVPIPDEAGDRLSPEYALVPDGHTCFRVSHGLLHDARENGGDHTDVRAVRANRGFVKRRHVLRECFACNTLNVAAVDAPYRVAAAGALGTSHTAFHLPVAQSILRQEADSVAPDGSALRLVHGRGGARRRPVLTRGQHVESCALANELTVAR